MLYENVPLQFDNNYNLTVNKERYFDIMI